MSFWQAVILGLIQGLTEFLPVSSSGHLVAAIEIIEKLLGGSGAEFLRRSESDFLLIVVLHVGTLVPVFVFFRRAVGRLVSGLAVLAHAAIGRRAWREALSSEQGRLAALVVVASVPTGAIGLLLKLTVLDRTGSSLFVAVAFLVTAACLLLAHRCGSAEKGRAATRFTDALFVGAAQGVAVFPGLSRSGLTVSAALARGLDRRFAVELSFLLSIPAILAGASLEMLGALSTTADSAVGAIPLASLLAGCAVAAISGYCALALVVRLVLSRRFHLFAWYLVPAAAVLFVLNIFG